MSWARIAGLVGSGFAVRISAAIAVVWAGLEVWAYVAGVVEVVNSAL